ncbi:GntR family transcriptional regulator [Porphyrobacter sp. ULC335]|uniref:GntR family transcriptional regulator n=1 Tax=Porphyrobacter sp. ULC335 TaxID=2854260 RepID=UPI00221FCCB2|nr:GntR family transcriptional regulator [Porphyrobacter sp. ULC335]
MSPAHVLEPTYQRLKRELMAGTYPMGSKLEAMRLAEEFGVSMTPVRDSLNQLTGEGLVDLNPGEGFRVSRMTDQGLRDMLIVNHVLLLHAAMTGESTGRLPSEGPEAHNYAARLGAVFAAIASASGNRFLVRSVDQIGERLGPARRMEPAIIPAARDTLLLLETSISHSLSDCVPALATYHASCLDAVPRLIAAIPGST